MVKRLCAHTHVHGHAMRVQKLVESRRRGEGKPHLITSQAVTWGRFPLLSQGVIRLELN